MAAPLQQWARVRGRYVSASLETEDGPLLADVCDA